MELRPAASKVFRVYISARSQLYLGGVQAQGVAWERGVQVCIYYRFAARPGPGGPGLAAPLVFVFLLHRFCLKPELETQNRPS